MSVKERAFSRPVKILVMIMRTTFLLAFILGAGLGLKGLPQDQSLIMLHIAIGIVFVVSVWIIAFILRTAGLWIAGILTLLGAGIGFSLPIPPAASGWFHAGLMVIAMGLAEMSEARAKKSH
ncbi:MAG: hypothetical protein OWS74_02850 [Firmicutes bacterium]|nr:hypothetical protein [Bacillota bacterium]